MFPHTIGTKGIGILSQIGKNTFKSYGIEGKEGRAISWKSKTQHTVACLICEAGYIRLVITTRENISDPANKSSRQHCTVVTVYVRTETTANDNTKSMTRPSTS